MSDCKNKCAVCDVNVKAMCRYTFCDFWGMKSGGGEGCNYPPWTARDAARLVARLKIPAGGREKDEWET